MRRDIVHEQLTGSSTQELLARLAVIERRGARRGWSIGEMDEARYIRLELGFREAATCKAA